jgi:alanine racemase
VIFTVFEGERMKELLGSTWTEVNLDSAKKNIINIRNFVDKKVQIMGVVKANAYGHDLIEISRILLENGADQLAVARIEEAIVLRKNNINAPILVLNVPLRNQLSLYLSYDIMPTISDLNSAEELDNIGFKSKKKAKVHLKMETGMGRIGIVPEKFLCFLRKINSLKFIDIQGIYTHFSTADEADKGYTEYQFKAFYDVMTKIKNNNIKIPFFHVANSAAILDLPNMWLDLVRPGCILYGYYPSNDVKRSIKLYPVMSVKTRIAFIKTIDTNKCIGYGRTYKTKRNTEIATLPVGYADGYPRQLSNRAEVLVKGVSVPVIGRICMDQTMIDITDIPGNLNIGDEVVLIGEQLGQTIPVETIAELSNTIPDEVVNIIDKARVAKLFIKGNKPWKIKNIFGEYFINGKRKK